MADEFKEMIQKRFKRALPVVQMLADGMNRREVAARLDLSPRTVEDRILNLSNFMGAKSIENLVAILLREKFIK